MVVGEVGLLVNGSQLKLVGSDLVMACFDRDAQAVALNLQVEHELLDAHGDGTEIVVLKLLVLRALVPHERAAGHH